MRADDWLATCLRCSAGVHNLYLLPTTHQLSWRRASLDHNDSWPSSDSTRLATKPYPAQSGHLRPSDLLGCQAWYPPVYLAKANPGYHLYCHESDGHLSGRLSRLDVGVSLDGYRVQCQRDHESLLISHVLGLFTQRPGTVPSGT